MCSYKIIIIIIILCSELTFELYIQYNSFNNGLYKKKRSKMNYPRVK